MDEKILKDRLIYCEKTGEFSWKEDPPITYFKNEHAFNTFKGRFAGKKAGHLQNIGGIYYITIRVHGKLYLAHRLAWLYITGKWPDNVIDHKDGDGTNNRFENLRDCTSTENIRNCKNPKIIHQV